MSGIAEWFGRCAEEEGSKKSFDKTPAGLPAGAMRHFDLRLAKADLGSSTPERSLAAHAGELRLVTRAAFRCS